MTAGLLKMDTVIASTTDNDTNILVTVLARHMIRTHRPDFAEQERTIALIKREEYAMLAAALGTNFAVNDKILAANEVMRYLRRGHVLSVCHLHGCEAEVVELMANPGSRITTQRLRDFRGFQGKFLIGAVKRDERWVIANGDMQIASDERVICVCADDALGSCRGCFWYETAAIYSTYPDIQYLEKRSKYWFRLCQYVVDYGGRDAAARCLFFALR